MSRPISRDGLTMQDLQRLNQTMNPPAWPAMRWWLLLLLVAAGLSGLAAAIVWAAATVFLGLARYLHAALLLWSCGGGPCG